MGVHGTPLQPVLPTEDLAKQRLLARVRAHELIDAAGLQLNDAALRAGLRDAEMYDWSEVAFLLNYAQFLQGFAEGSDVTAHVQWMTTLSTRLADPTMQSVALSARARLGNAGDPALESAADADLARAATLLTANPARGRERVLAQIACAETYHQMDLWELAEDLLRAADEGVRTSDPTMTDPVGNILRRQVDLRRMESRLLQSATMLEMGRRVASRESASEALHMRRYLTGATPEMAGALQSAEYLLMALAGRDESVPFEQALSAAMSSYWQGYVGYVHLGRAIRQLDNSQYASAAVEAERAAERFTPNLQPSLRVLAIGLASSASAAPPASARYVRQVSLMRQRARLHFLGAARARLELETVRQQPESTQAQGYLDPLTGLSNQRGYFRYIQRMTNHARAGVASAMVVDVDLLDSIRDYSSPLADEVLRRIAEVFVEHVRPADLVARIAPNQFALILDGLPEPQAAERARRMAWDVASLPWHSVDQSLAVTISAGVAAGPHQQIRDLMGQAEARLASARMAGVGAVVASGY